MRRYSTFQKNVCSAPTELNGQKGHIFLKGTYVGLSRVRSSNCLRLLPKQTSKPDFEHLLKLKIPVSILRWKKGFDLQTGIWSRHATHSETNENVSTRKRGRKSK